MTTFIDNMLKILFVMVISYFSARLFLNLTNFAFAIYGFTPISKILPFVVVIIAFWALLVTFAVFGGMMLRNIQSGLNFIIIFLPMSALPFILLGMPQAALNQVFICRSSVIIFALMLVMFWFVQNAITKRQRIRLPYLLNIFVFLMLYGGHFFSVDSKLQWSVLEASFVLIVVSAFFYFVISWATDYETIHKIMKVMAISCIVQSVLSFFSFYYYVIVQGDRTYSFSGFLRDYELFAEYLAVHVPIILYMVRNESGKSLKRFFAWGLGLVIFVLLATVIRGALISLLIAMVYYFVNLRKISQISRILRMILIFFVIGAVSLWAIYYFLPASARIVERFLATDLITGDTRRFVWLEFLDYFVEHPIWGHGMFYNLAGASLFWPHSTYFYYLLTIGALGLLNYLILLFGIIRKGWENLRITRLVPRNFEMAVALNSALIVIIIDGLKVDYQRYSNYQLFIWIVFALIVALNYMKNKIKPSGADV